MRAGPFPLRTEPSTNPGNMETLITLRTNSPSPAEPRTESACGRRGAVGGRLGRRLLLIGLLLWPMGRAMAQPSPRAEIHVSADSVKVGERFTVALVAEHPAGSQVDFPTAEAGSALFGELTVLRRGEIRRSRKGDGSLRVDSVAYEVVTFALDSARVPVLPVRLISDQDTTVLGTAPRVVPVVSVVPSGADGLRTPAALAAFPRSFWVWGGLGLAVMVLVGGGAYAWWRWREDPEPAPRTEDDPDPYGAAVTRLQHLEHRNPNDLETCRAFYVDLTQTLRVYLAKRVGVRALECTTAELVEALQRRPEIPTEVTQRVQTVLEEADLVKFAGTQPKPEKTRRILEEAQGVLGALEAAQRRAESRASSTEAPSPP